MEKKVGISLLVLIISGCVLLSAALIVGGYFLLRAQKNYTPPTATAALTVVPTPSTAAQMDEIQQQVMEIRGLTAYTRTKT